MTKFILLLSSLFISVFAIGQNNDIFKVRAKHITMKTSTTEYGPPAVVDFLVAIDFNSSRITFYREKKETYDIIKSSETKKDDEGSSIWFDCKNEDLKDYEVCFYTPNTQDKVIFILKQKGSIVTTAIFCSFIKE